MAIINFYLKRFIDAPDLPKYLTNQGGGNRASKDAHYNNQSKIWWLYDANAFSSSPSTSFMEYYIPRTTTFVTGVFDLGFLFFYTTLGIGSTDKTLDAEWVSKGWDTSTYTAFKTEVCNTIAYGIRNTSFPEGTAYSTWNVNIYYNYTITGLTGIRHVVFFSPGNDPNADEVIPVDI